MPQIHHNSFLISKFLIALDMTGFFVIASWVLWTAVVLTAQRNYNYITQPFEVHCPVYF